MAASENDDIKIPLKWRLRAWWHGYDLEDVKAKLSGKPLKDTTGQSPDDSPEETADTSGNQSPPEEETSEVATEENHIAVKAVWDKERAHVAQVFWGDGFCGPGGPENIINITAPLNINSKRTSMVVGAGLGGPVRAMQKEYKTPVHGYESSEELASTGMNMSEESGVAGDAPVIHLDLENTEQFPQKYDRAYAKESLFTITNKIQLVKTVFAHLKADGLFLLTDYILSETADQESNSFKEWKLLEPYPPEPATAADMESYLKEAGFVLKENEDITDFYLDLIAKARAHAKKVITTMESDDVKDVTILKYMHNEAVFWDTRAKLLRDGDLRVMKYLCYKSG